MVGSWYAHGGEGKLGKIYPLGKIFTSSIIHYGTGYFKGWIINAASHDKKEEKYLVELKNGADTRKVKFNKDGEELKD